MFVRQEPSAEKRLNMIYQEIQINIFVTKYNYFWDPKSPTRFDRIFNFLVGTKNVFFFLNFTKIKNK